MADTNREFERYMSDLGEATNPAGGGVYQSPRVRRRFDDFRAGFEAARALASRSAEVDEKRRTGYVLVPLEPTPEMIEAFSDQLEGACGSYFDWERGGDEGYKAMIEAAPSHTTNKEKG